MTHDEVKTFNSRVGKLLSEGKLREAFADMRAHSERIMAWELTSRIDAIEQHYKYMLKYLADGVTDPERAGQYANIVNASYTLLDAVTREMKLPDTATLYFNTVRSQRATPGRGITAQTQRYLGLADRYEAEAEGVARDLFSAIWATFPLGNSDIESITALTGSEDVPWSVRQLMVSALWLGAIEYFDEQRMVLLARMYVDDTLASEIRMIALAGMMFALLRHSEHTVPPKLRHAIDAMKESATWHSDMIALCLEMTRTLATEEISRKLRDDVFPELMQLGKEIEKKLNNNELPQINSPEDLVENPEWEEIMRSKGLHDKLMELSELQSDGGDVYMASFAHLKHFPFFNHISGWFMPFDARQSQVASMGSKNAGMIELLTSMPFLCDSDKYSVVFSLSSMPQSQAMGNAFQKTPEMEEMLRSMHDEKGVEDRHRAFFNGYIKNVYRFYNVYSRRGEFYNPLAHSAKITTLAIVGDIFSEADTLEIVAEFLFRQKLYGDAMAVLQRLDAVASPTAERFQKLGFCAERSGDYVIASEYYDRAYLLDGNSRWTIRRLAVSMGKLRHYDRAATLWQKLVDQEPEDIGLLLRLASSLTHSGKYADALPVYYKIEYLDDGNVKAKRGRAWSQLMLKQFDEAETTFATLALSAEARPIDFVNAGHAALARNDYAAAIMHYRDALNIGGLTSAGLSEAFDHDAESLKSLGVDTAQVPMLVDAISYINKSE
ncbi:MAG: tetratricopeptide repeat protein [Muribaculaceae bacterium]